MHRAALQGLRLVGNKLTAKEEEHIATKVCTNLDHRTITTVLSVEAEVDDLGHHHQSTTKAQGTEEPEDPGLLARHMIMKMMKNRWEHHPLLAESAPHLCPKYSNCPMISRNTTDLRSHSHGSQKLQVVKILGSSKETAMQSLQLHLTGTSRSWLGKLGRKTMNSQNSSQATSSQHTSGQCQ
jgi:hypothetical protein